MPQPKTVEQYSASFAEINAKNQEYIKAIKKHRAFSQIAKILRLPSLAEIYTATHDNSLAARRVHLIDTLVNELRAIGKIPSNVQSTVVEHLGESSNGVENIIAKLIKAIAKEPFDTAAVESVKKSLNVLAAAVSDHYGINLFYQYLSFQGQIHCPVMIEIYNAMNEPNPAVLLNQRVNFIKKIIDTVHTLYLSNLAILAEKMDISVTVLNRLLANNDFDALAEIFKGWVKQGTQDIAMLSNIALLMLESRKNNDTNGIELSTKIWEIYSQWQKHWFADFGKDAKRDGLIIKDKQYQNGKKLSFVIEGNQVVCIESDPHFATTAFPTGIIFKKQVVYSKKPGESDEFATAIAFAEYLRKNYKVNNELIAYILSTLHQGGYKQGYFSIQHNLKPLDGRFTNPAISTPELCFDLDQQLQSIVVNQHFYGFSFEDRSDNLLLADMKIVNEYPGKFMQGNEPLEHYIPGTLSVDQGMVTYEAKCEQGQLTVTDVSLLEDSKVLSACEERPRSHRDDEAVAVVRCPVTDDSLTRIIAEELAETPAVKPAPVVVAQPAVFSVEPQIPAVKPQAKGFFSYFTNNPGKALLFFLGGSLLVTVGIAAWPFTTALLAGAGFVGAVAAIATFVTGMAIPVAVASGLGTIAGGFLATTLAAFTSKTPSEVTSPAVQKIAEPVAVQPQPAVPETEVPVAFSDRVTLRKLKAARLMQEKQQLEQLRNIIQLIKDSFDAKGKTIAIDLHSLMTKDALLIELKNYIEPLMARDGSSENLMRVFNDLLQRVTTIHEPGISRTAPVDLIGYLEQLGLSSLNSILDQMRAKLPRTPDHSPRGEQTPRDVSPERDVKNASTKPAKSYKAGDDKQEGVADAAATAASTTVANTGGTSANPNNHTTTPIPAM